MTIKGGNSIIFQGEIYIGQDGNAIYIGTKDEPAMAVGNEDIC